MKVSYTVYNIDSLGYYSKSGAASNFPSSETLLASLVAWGKSVSQINNTKTYSPSEQTTRHATFFADGHFDPATSEVVLALWKEVNSNRGDVYGLSRSNKPGQGQILTRSFDYNKVIPGFPVYFWFRPKENKMIALEFEHSDKGKQNLEHFIQGFLNWRAAPWCVVAPKVKIDETNYSKVLKGYSSDGTEQKIDESVRPHVFLSLNKSGDTLAQLLAARPKITRLQRTEAIEFSDDANENQTLAERIYEGGVFKGIMSNPRRLAKVRYKSEITWKPTEQEVIDLYNNVSQFSPDGGLYNLVAITSAGKRISFFGNAVKENIQLAMPNQKSNGFIPAAALYSAIDQNRTVFP